MRVRQTRICLYLASVGCLAAGALCLTGSSWLPHGTDESWQTANKSTVEVKMEQSTSLPPMERLVEASARPLRAPLVDPPKPKKPPQEPRKKPPKKKPPAKRPPPEPKLALLGTMMEVDNSWAVLLSKDDNKIHLCRVGEPIGDDDKAPIVREISDAHVVIEHLDRSLTLRFKDTQEPKR